ncbi:MAG: hypothetical protein AAFQ84_09970 [Pseudomonadota bacterium]
MTFLVWVFALAAILVSARLVRRAGLGDRAVIAVLLGGLLATIGYIFVGTPALPDQPYSKRLEEIASRDATRLTPAETLARLEQLVRDQPDDPQPHFFIGEVMKSQGRDSDAVRAYQSALRRDSNYVPALVALADALTRLSDGIVQDTAKQIYARAVAIDRSQVRAGFMAGLSDWQAGDATLARARWENLRQSLAETDPNRQMLEALIARAESEPSP